uniref:Uncharacterized protein n=1 Tax=Cacopsylla melanoneura TaxID=428564 RepID=A0A8D8LD77_9HEMI
MMLLNAKFPSHVAQGILLLFVVGQKIKISPADIIFSHHHLFEEKKPTLCFQGLKGNRYLLSFIFFLVRRFKRLGLCPNSSEPFFFTHTHILHQMQCFLLSPILEVSEFGYFGFPYCHA